MTSRWPGSLADAVLYEGYLLYPYRSTAAKNQVRWQFGVLGPPGAASAGARRGSRPRRRVPAAPAARDGAASRPVSVTGFLQLQRRQAERADGAGGFTPVAELRAGATAGRPGTRPSRSSANWAPSPSPSCAGSAPARAGRRAEEVEHAPPGGWSAAARRCWTPRSRLTRRRGRRFPRLRVAVRNTGRHAAGKDAALRSSLSARTC